MLIRVERPEDVAGIAAVLADAFGRPGESKTPSEVGLVAALRESDSWVASQSLVAVEGDLIIGHCLCSRAFVDETPVLALGPIGVRQDWQGRGVGSALVRQAIDIAIDMGEELIGLLGDPAFYGRFGFVAASDLSIESPDPAWGRAFQARQLGDSPVTGRFEYAAPFLESVEIASGALSTRPRPTPPS